MPSFLSNSGATFHSSISSGAITQTRAILFYKCTTNTQCSLSSSPSRSQKHIQSPALRQPHLSVCFPVYLHPCCHYLLAEAIICLEQGASSALLCIRPHRVLNLNRCKPCCSDSPPPCYTLLYPFCFTAKMLRHERCFSAVPSIKKPPLFRWTSV